MQAVVQQRFQFSAGPSSGFSLPERWLGGMFALAVLALAGSLYHVITALERSVAEAIAVRAAETSLDLTFGSAVRYAPPSDGTPGSPSESNSNNEHHIAKLDGAWRRLNFQGHAFHWVDRGEIAKEDAGSFRRWAWAELARRIAAAPAEPERWGALWRMESQGDTHAVRYLSAAHVLPGGQLNAAIEIVVPADDFRAFAAAQTNRTRILVGAIGSFGVALLAGLTFLAVRAARRQKRLAVEFERLARVDPLTGLQNRRALAEALAQLTSQERPERPFGLLLVDLDNFKTVNDSLGHLAGDEVLGAVSARLSTAIRESDHVYRMSGDEYVVVARNVALGAGLGAVAGALCEAVRKPLQVGGQEIFLSASIGVAHWPTDGHDEQTLLRHADIAMYRAKEAGRDRYCIYASEMDAKVAEKLQLTTSLRRALERNEFVVHYQPKFDAETLCIVGFEALLRWEHPREGLLSPSRFISHAEDSGAIEQIGDWVLRAALSQARGWREAAGFEGKVAVNVSLRQLHDADFAGKVRRALAEKHVAATSLELEVTESIVSHDPVAAAKVFRELADLGVTITLDDFGTGQSSLASLRNFPVQSLKIDKSFVDGMDSSNEARSIVRAVISMSHSLTLKVVAEGVENASQLTALREDGCDYLQGFHLGKPVTACEACKLLKVQRAGLAVPA